MKKTFLYILHLVSGKIGRIIVFLYSHEFLLVAFFACRTVTAKVLSLKS